MKQYLVGLDEAGRGSLAGPVAAGCVLLPSDFPTGILNDSKKLSPKKRLKAESLIKEEACWGVALIDHRIIDAINILQASLLAMKQAYFAMLASLPDWALAHGLGKISSANLAAIADGTFCPDVSCAVSCEPHADATYPPVMAASILAKTCRDRLMAESYDKLYPQYGYAKHKGYPTPEHLQVCRELGPSPIQRLTFSLGKETVIYSN